MGSHYAGVSVGHTLRLRLNKKGPFRVPLLYTYTLYIYFIYFQKETTNPPLPPKECVLLWKVALSIQERKKKKYAYTTTKKIICQPLDKTKKVCYNSNTMIIVSLKKERTCHMFGYQRNVKRLIYSD